MTATLNFFPNALASIHQNFSYPYTKIKNQNSKNPKQYSDPYSSPYKTTLLIDESENRQMLELQWEITSKETRIIQED